MSSRHIRGNLVYKGNYEHMIAGDITAAMLANKSLIMVNKTSGAATAIALPAMQYIGQAVKIVDAKGDAATNNITITPATGTINGAATLVISEHYGAVELVWDGTNFTIGAQGAAVSAAELAFLNGVVAGTPAASKAVVLGTTKDIGAYRMTGKLFTPQADPEVAADTASLTDAQMLSGILVATPTAAAAYTVRTGTQLQAAVLAIFSALTAGDCFDLTIINIGGTGDDITLTAATGITIVGDAVVRPSADSGTEQAGQGTFRFRYTAANTFIAYRVS